MNQSIFKTARLIAQNCKLAGPREILRSRTDECKEVFDRFNISASAEDMELLIARWTRLLLAIKAVQPLTPTDPIGGRMPMPREYDASALAPRAAAA